MLVLVFDMTLGFSFCSLALVGRSVEKGFENVVFFDV